jgi:hypothetical protein
MSGQLDIRPITFDLVHEIRGKSGKRFLFKRCSIDVQDSVQMLVTAFKYGSNPADLLVEKASAKGG